MKQLLNWLRRGRLEHGLDRELQYHFDRRVSDFLASGLPLSEARRRASLELGGLTQVREEVRDVWLTRWLRDLVGDLRYSARSFLRSPSFAAAAVLSLALGIGATTAIYSLVDQVILHGLPVRQPDRLVLVDWRGDQVASGFGSWNLMSYPMCRALQGQERFFDGVLCRALTRITLSTGGDPRPASAEIVSGSYFSVLGVAPAAGRVLEDADDAAAASPVVVLSHDFWKAQLGGAPDVIGRKILVNQHPMTVVGIAAPEFHGIDVGEVPSLWIPAAQSAQALPGFYDLLNRRTRWMQILGRLKQDVTAEQAQSGLQPWFKAMLDEDMRRPEFPKITPERRRRYLSSVLTLTAAPQGHSGLRRSLSQPLWVLFAATGLLLCLACLNVAGLFLARGSARERELSTRLALGASRGRIGRQFLADSILLALAGGLLGVALAPAAMRALLAFLPSDTAANALRADIDLRLLLFAFLVSLAAGIFSGLAPALYTGRRSLIDALRERGAAAPGGIWLRKAIVAAQIAFSLVLVIGAGLFVRTLVGLLEKGPGFDTSSLIYFGVDPRKNGYDAADASRLVHRIHEAIRASAIAQASAVVRFPFLHGGSWNDPVTIQADRRTVTDRDVNLNAVTPGFFATMGVRIVAGRDFDERDAHPNATTGRRAAIVNEAFVKRHLGGRNPLGIHICEGGGPDAKPDIEVVGVVTDFNYRGLREQSEQVFFPLGDGFAGGGNFYVKIRGNPDQAYQQIRAIVRNADPALPINFFRTVEEQVSRSLNTERLLAALSAAFGVLALLLSLVGLCGVTSYVVTRRTREIGIRMALGATAGSAIWLVLRDAVIMIAAGLAIALPCVSALGKLVESQLFGVAATDPLTIAQAALLLTAASLGAALVPAWQATRVNPIDALRLD